MVKDALKVLTGGSPRWEHRADSVRTKEYAEIKAKLAKLESELSTLDKNFALSPDPKTLFLARIRLLKYESMLAHRKDEAERLAPDETHAEPTGGPATVSHAAAPAAVASTAGTSEILRASLAEFRAMDAAAKLQFSQDGGALAFADFRQLSMAEQIEHCRKGGRIIPQGATTANQARPVQLTGDSLMDQAIVSEGASSLAAMRAKGEVDRLTKTVSSLPAGSMSRLCAEERLAEAKRELQNCK